jgi:ribosomal protein S20
MDTRLQVINSVLPLVIYIEKKRAPDKQVDTQAVKQFVIKWEKSLHDKHSIVDYNRETKAKLEALRTERDQLDTPLDKKISSDTMEEMCSVLTRCKNMLFVLALLNNSSQTQRYKQAITKIQQNTMPVDELFCYVRTIETNVTKDFQHAQARLKLNYDEIMELAKTPLGILQRIVELEGCGNLRKRVRNVSANIGASITLPSTVE